MAEARTTLTAVQISELWTMIDSEALERLGR
jgi:hypothetical protein